MTSYNLACAIAKLALATKWKIEVPGEFTLFKALAPGITPKKRDALYLRKATSNAVISFSFQSND